MKQFYEPPELITPDMEAEIVFVAPSGTPFGKKLLTYCLVWLAVIGIACGLMWSVMQQYEEALPATAMDEYIESSRQDMFFFALSDMFDKIDNRFESAFETASTISKEYSGTLTYSKLATEYTHDRPVYIIQHNGENLFKVTLSEGEETGFMKFNNFFVDKVELIKTDILDLSSYKIVFASNMLIYINSTALGTSLDKYEQIDVFGESQYLAIKLANFTCEPQIVALEYLNEVVPDKVVNAKRVSDFYIFELADDPLTTVTVTVPTGSVVAIDDKTVSDVFISETYTDIGTQTEMTVYTIPTVYRAYTISASKDGKNLPLIEEEENIFSTPLSDKEYIINVPNDAELYLNGSLVDSTMISDESVMWHSDFDEMKNYPTAVQYTVKGASSLSDFTASLNGESLTAYTDKDTLVFAASTSEELKEEYGEKATEFIRQYMFYNSQGYRNTEKNLANTLKLVAPGSPLRNYLNLANVGIEFKSPQNMEIEYLEADDFVAYGDDTFACNVSYKITLKDNVNVSVEEDVIRLIFTRSGNTFLPAKFIL